MGCGGRSATTQLVQISAKPMPAKQRVLGQDFHCPDCGLTLKKRKPGYFHVCPGERRIEYQELRRSKCDQCEHAKENVCVKYQEIHPDRDCFIDTGVKIPWAACPERKWSRVMVQCVQCGRTVFNADGVRDCTYCGWPVG